MFSRYPFIHLTCKISTGESNLISARLADSYSLMIGKILWIRL